MRTLLELREGELRFFPGPRRNGPQASAYISCYFLIYQNNLITPWPIKNGKALLWNKAGGIYLSICRDCLGNCVRRIPLDSCGLRKEEGDVDGHVLAIRTQET